jgi:hypothetical protein
MPLLLPWLVAAACLAPAPQTQAAALPTDIEAASLMTTPVLLFNGARQMSQGTGFFFANTTADGAPDTVFLVTNVHVVTGHPPGSTTRDGDRVRIFIHESSDDLTRMRRIELPLYDDRGAPKWIASDTSPTADVVLLPIPRETYRDISVIVFTEGHTRSDIRIRPTSGATLLGYPYGFYDSVHFLPVWKTGHVASEPNVDFDGLPLFLVDVSAFPGMSGSPVLAVASGIYESEDGSMRTGRVLRLLGIFSAMPVVRQERPGDAVTDTPPQTTEISLQLGYVWKAALIADLASRYHAR